MESVIIKCKRGTADQLGSDISDGLITTQAMAEARGKRYLDDPEKGGHYKVFNYSVEIPHKGANCDPGNWLDFTVSRLGYTNKKMKILEYEIFSTGKPGIVRAKAELQVFDT